MGWARARREWGSPIDRNPHAGWAARTETRRWPGRAATPSSAHLAPVGTKPIDLDGDAIECGDHQVDLVGPGIHHARRAAVREGPDGGAGEALAVQFHDGAGADHGGADDGQR